MMESPSYSDTMNSTGASLGSVADNDPSYRVNIRIMIAAIIVLFSVILFILSLHLYAKWFWKNSQFANRRRRLLQLQQIHEIQQQLQAAQDDFHHGYPNNHFFHNPAAVGLDKSLIEALPVFIFSEEEGKKVSDCCCAVCLCEFQNGDRARTLPKCAHSFHTDCIDMWLHSHSTCPLCRQSLVLDEPEESTAPFKTDDLLLLRCPPILPNLEELVIVTSASRRDSFCDSGVASASASSSSTGSGSDPGENTQEVPQIQLVVESSEKSVPDGSCISAKSRWRNLRRMLRLRDASGCSTPSLCSPRLSEPTPTRSSSSVHPGGESSCSSISVIVVD